ncbi:hypothetical protein DPEC_G00277330 [Dallia pectoralis]|uniref:Uncharacterized protein n=1 Tax=Dallia pectoralis TaxID=75939 RepID=A0ACC2FLY3_DALPE|nr:hypothetical protein DPEC_G00277330 [Dallia pectoralis]
MGLVTQQHVARALFIWLPTPEYADTQSNPELPGPPRRLNPVPANQAASIRRRSQRIAEHQNSDRPQAQPLLPHGRPAPSVGTVLENETRPAGSSPRYRQRSVGRWNYRTMPRPSPLTYGRPMAGSRTQHPHLPGDHMVPRPEPVDTPEPRPTSSEEVPASGTQ